ncbi:MAG: hypothetical protein L6243_04325 [Candidatus Altiarchaeales archaeon]|nr:hypothetical protein [Candidatus Altiarchaeota archaeon]MCG2782795.1 hypothetical protein [Candidatus Altiarchaeales archaeon]MBU4266734.1 hypothetical protein [Candidatus Altiarchaeota archaeon]MBU4341487.1 hypothetical protein [Candidatus Altiarchaeota archaeon]MBU4406341.1 hypothetical protein [Candidatus Altiarchaeota archaeon]
MDEKTEKPAGKAKAAPKPAAKKLSPKQTEKPAAKTAPKPAETPKPTKEPAAETQPKPVAKKPAAEPKPRGPKKPRAIISLREGEYGKSARIEFPHPYYVHKILEVTEPEEQKKYRFRYFNNILVAGLHSEGLSEFLQKGARKAGFELEIVTKR